VKTSAAFQEIERLDGLAYKTRTACGPEAMMTWRRWGEGPAVVLLHGGAGSWMHWIRNIEALAQTHTVWTPDMPGFGDSDLPGDGLDADTLAPFVRDGLIQLLRGQPFSLVGFSFGGLVAALIAAGHPPGLERLVLVSVAALGLLSAPPALKSMRGSQDDDERREVLRSNLNALMLYSADSVDELAIDIQARSASRDRVKNRKQVLTDIMLSLAPRWQCPAYGLWGRRDVLYRDQFGSLERVTDGLGLRNRTIFDDAGHWLQYEKAEQFNKVLASILSEPSIMEGGHASNAK